MKKPLIFLSLLIMLIGLIGSYSTGKVTAENESKKVVDYKIDVQLKLDEKQHPNMLQATEQLVWLNDSSDTINDLQFHLYLNAFKNEKSTFFKESGGQLRGDRFEPGQWGWIDVTEIKIAGGEDLTPRKEFIHPDDDNADDQTVMRIPLSKPLKPGEKITLDIKFNAKLPRVFARTGYWGGFAMVGQWFPKIGVWETKGERRREVPGWNCHQFHANSEFYADFGSFDVRITVPAIYKEKIGATGKWASNQDNPDGTVTYNFKQENVHDFAWTIDNDYVVTTRRFKAADQVTRDELDRWAEKLNLPLEQIVLTDVEVTVLLQPEHRDQVDRHFAAAFNAIKHFGLWYGRYPYQTLTVVDPPYNGGGAGGMEYPTLITAGTTWWPTRGLTPEGVIVHEFGHQFWYGLVATNEFEESWMDEGFNTYSTAKVLGTAYGREILPIAIFGVPLFNFPLELEPSFMDRLMTLQGKFDDPVLTPAWKYINSRSYSLNSYPRTGLVLNTLERYLGEDRMAKVMRAYHQKWRYRHPTSQDFFDSVKETTGEDFTWFFDQFVKGTNTLDYEIVEISNTPVKERAGVFDEQGKKVEVEEKKAEKGSEKFDSEVTVRRAGEAWFPVEMAFNFKDGSSVTAIPKGVHDGVIDYNLTAGKDGRQWTDSWAIKDRWKKFKFPNSAEMISAQIDPAQKVLLDANLTNNTRQESATGIGAASRWSSGALFWIQSILQAFTLLS